jgi:hypothetical protein
MLPVVPNPIYEYNKNASNASVHMAGFVETLYSTFLCWTYKIPVVGVSITCH